MVEELLPANCPLTTSCFSFLHDNLDFFHSTQMFVEMQLPTIAVAYIFQLDSVSNLLTASIRVEVVPVSPRTLGGGISLASRYRSLGEALRYDSPPPSSCCVPLQVNALCLPAMAGTAEPPCHTVMV